MGVGEGRAGGRGRRFRQGVGLGPTDRSHWKGLRECDLGKGHPPDVDGVQVVHLVRRFHKHSLAFISCEIPEDEINCLFFFISFLKNTRLISLLQGFKFVDGGGSVFRVCVCCYHLRLPPPHLYPAQPPITLVYFLF